LKIDPKPDFGRLEKVLRRQGEPDRVPFFELFSQLEGDVLRLLGRAEGPPANATDRDLLDHGMRQHIQYMYWTGYDYVNAGPLNFGFPQSDRSSGRTRAGGRGYVTAASHTIASREDFEKYPWPEASAADWSPLERIGQFLPDGMKVIAGGPGGVLENVMWLLGYEGISFLLQDDPALVRDMFDAVGSRLVAYFDVAASFDVVGAVILGDDMGFKTQTLLSPDAFRTYVFPWHRKIVAAIHRYGKPALLHACGNLTEVTDDIIDCGWDARHSFEDVVEPIWEAKAKYGDRIALLGGFDMDKISRLSEAEVRAHTRLLIERCAPGGGWALGTGNSVADYVPASNFLAMLEEGFQAGVY